MRQPDQPVSKPVGHYRTYLGGGFYAAKAYYASRWHDLEAVKQRAFQVLTTVLGELMWINIEPSQVVDTR